MGHNNDATKAHTYPFAPVTVDVLDKVEGKVR